jgi:predicted PurR-regulated permease PerM
LLSLWIAQDFLNPLSWAVVVTVASWPIYKKFALWSSLQGKDIAAPLLFTLFLGLLVFIPVAAAISEASVATEAISQTLARFRETGIPVPNWLDVLPFGDQLTQWWSANLSDPDNARRLLGASTDQDTQISWVRSVAGQLVQRTSMILVTLIATFTLLRRGAWLGNQVLDTADRLFGDPGERLARRMIETIRGTVTGTVLVAFGEGAILCIAYIAVGVPQPFLFAIVTAAFAMVPLGAWVVFSAASILVAVQGASVALALALFAFGAIIMIVGDTIVWPWLVGNRSRLPFLIALIGIFGGLHTFGLVGLFVGPVLLAACWIVLRDWLLASST